MSRFEKTVTLELPIIRDEKSDDAILIMTEDEEEKWIPRSHIRNVGETSDPDIFEIEMTEWIATEKGLI